MKRARFLGRHIIVRREFAKALVEGSKTTTIRRGIYKLKHRTLIVHDGSRPVAIVNVKYVYYKRLGAITDEEARRDGFPSKQELLKALRKLYPDIKEDDVVTVIGLEVVKRLDSVDDDKPLGGLAPEDVARLGLRYLSDTLEKEEKIVLEDLTRTRDPSLTAKRLFGDPGLSTRVEHALEKVYRELIKRGLLRMRGSQRLREQ